MLTILNRRTKGGCQVTGKQDVEVVTIRCGEAPEQTIAMSELIKIIRFQTPVGAGESATKNSRSGARAHTDPPSS